MNNPREVAFSGVRVRYDATKSYDDLVRALLSDIGSTPMSVESIARGTGTWESFRDRIEPLIGPSGFVLFALLDHGAWITKANIDRKVLRVVLGNPLIAITMLRHDVTAGLFAPVEVLLTDEGEGRSSLTYVKPSSLMVVQDNPQLLGAATVLDAKLAALAASVTREPVRTAG